jgi:putative colanic acid biosynthesis UDP-glucose lipid carrier transferase
LPQLFDVLSGQLTLIGPRPILPYETAKVNPDLLEERLGYKPGLTGWAQVNGLRGGRTSVESFERMIDLDIDYMRRRTFLTDMGILWRTVIGIILKGNAY